MAVVQYTGIVNQLRGKLNGSVFNKGKTSFTMQKKQQPPQGWRGNQLLRRSNYSFVQRRWKELTDVQRNNWQTTAINNPSTDRFGNPVILSGYNQFIKANILNMIVFNGIIPNGWPLPAPSSGLTGFAMTGITAISNAAGEIIMSGTATGTYTGTRSNSNLILDVSLPQSTGVTVYHRGWRIVGHISTTIDLPHVWVQNLGDRYPALAPGGQLFFRARIFHRPSGAILFTSVSRYVVPFVDGFASASFTYDGGTGVGEVAVSYTPPFTGFPPFYQIKAYRVANTPVQPTAQSVGQTPAPDIELGLATDNFDDFIVGVAPGNWVGVRLDLVFASTGQVIDTYFNAVQNV